MQNRFHRGKAHNPLWYRCQCVWYGTFQWSPCLSLAILFMSESSLQRRRLVVYAACILTLDDVAYLQHNYCSLSTSSTIFGIRIFYTAIMHLDTKEQRCALFNVRACFVNVIRAKSDKSTSDVECDLYRPRTFVFSNDESMCVVLSGCNPCPEPTNRV